MRTHDPKFLRSVRIRARVLTDKNGELLEESVLVQRIGWLGELTTELAQHALKLAWNEAGFTTFADEKLPSHAAAAWERCFGRPAHPDGCHLDSRAVRVALARAGQTLRSQAHPRQCLDFYLHGWPYPATKPESRNAIRRVRKYEREHDGQKPTDFFMLAPAPPTLNSRTVGLGAVDRQFCEWERSGRGQAVLRIKLPTCARPASMRDWVWHRLVLRIPPLVTRRLQAGAKLAKPMLSIRPGKVTVLVITEQPKPPVRHDTDAPVLGLDWGERRLLTGSVLRPHKDGVVRTDGRPLFFDSKGAQAHLGRLIRQAGFLRGRAARMKRLFTGRPDATLLERVAQLEAELDLVWQQYRDVSADLSHAAARWAVEQARAHGCGRIIIEDLATLEARKLGRGVNGRVNRQLRGRLFKHIAEKAAEHGITVETVPPRGTSARCPRCPQPARHQRASNDPRAGRGWTVCSCGYSGDRDHASAERIGAIGITDDSAASVKVSVRPALAAAPTGRRSRRRRPHSKSPSSLPSLSSDQWAVPVGSAARVRRGVTPRDPAVSAAGDQRTESTGLTARSIMSSCSEPESHRVLTGMRTGLAGHARFTLTQREAKHRQQRPHAQENSTTGRTLLKAKTAIRS